MSEFIKHIKSEILHKNRPQRFMPLRSVSKIIDEPISVNIQRLYEIKVEWATRGYCEPRHFDKYFRNVVRELREAIYGEFRDKLIVLERAIYEQEVEPALKALDAIMREVEGEEHPDLLK